MGSVLDISLTERDVLELSSADAICAFFARLGYDTSRRIVQQPGHLGITAEGTAGPIRKVELVADERGLLQVYLFELKSITVALRDGRMAQRGRLDSRSAVQEERICPIIPPLRRVDFARQVS
jgi:hypothetical protein